MTGPIRDMVRLWLEDENIDPRHYAAVITPPQSVITPRMG